MCPDKTCTGGPQKLADEQAAIIGLASTKKYLFWATRGSVGRYPKDITDDGGTVQVDNGTVAGAVALAADDGFFYFTYLSSGLGGVVRCPIDGCSATDGGDLLAYDFERPAGLGLGDGGFAFAAGLDFRSIVYCSPQCIDPPTNMPTVLAERQAEPDTIALDGTRAYWTNALAGPGDGVVRAALDEPHVPSTLASIASPGALALDDAFVYFAGRADGSIHKVPKGGGPDVVLVVGQPRQPRALAVDDKRVYFVDEVSAGGKTGVMWVAK
jgi:hypothetical protein